LECSSAALALPPWRQGPAIGVAPASRGDVSSPLDNGEVRTVVFKFTTRPSILESGAMNETFAKD
jgi:hypothetical protein